MQKNKSYWRNEEGKRANSRNVLYIKLKSGQGKNEDTSPPPHPTVRYFTDVFPFLALHS
jgi:hypothetical protein